MTTKKPESDTAHFTFMRGQPFTTGHAKVLHHVMSAAKHDNADHHIFLSHTQDAKKNPLTHEQKVHFAQRAVPGANIHTEKHIKTPIDALKHLHDKGYKHVVMHVGEDRHQDMHNLVHQYNGKEYKFHKLEVRSAGHRDPDAEGTEGMSGTKMREAAKAKNFKEFSKGVAHKPDAKAMMHAVRKGLKLEQNQAVILCGGPSSGKDFILREALLPSGAAELPIGSYLESAIEEPLNKPPLILNGNAQDYETIIVEAAKLQEHGYDVAMVFVYTSDETSHERNEARRETGAKTITETTRAAKYAEATKAMGEYHQLFGEAFFLFDNSADVRSLNEHKQAQITIWLNELVESLEQHFSKPNINELFEVAFDEGKTIVDMIAKKGTPNQQGDKYKGGIARANTDIGKEIVESGSRQRMARNYLQTNTNTTHKGYLIKYNPVHGEYHVSKGGQHITTQQSLEHAKKAIDSLHEDTTSQNVVVTQTSAPGAKLNKKKPAKSVMPPDSPGSALFGTIPSAAAAGLSADHVESVDMTMRKGYNAQGKTLAEMRKQRINRP